MKNETKETMTSKHTPGPWRVEKVPSSSYGQLRIASDGIRSDWQHKDDVHDPRGESVASGIYEPADARLIAAAPEMLEVLEEILDVMPYARLMDEGGEHPTWTKAKALLARMDGGRK